jgi:glucosamine kinase
MTAFLSGLLDRFGGALGVVAFSLTARPADFAGLAREVIASDDSAARDILAANVSQVARMIGHLQGDWPLPVTFTGGLGPAYAEALDGQWSQRAARGTALDGALQLARSLG